jgi:FHA domain/von Willebrand factor type A domain
MKKFILTSILLTFSLVTWALDLELIATSQPQPNRLECEYRLIQVRPIDKVEAKLGNVGLPIINTTPYPFTDSKTAILFLVDTSRSRNSRAIGENIKHLQELLKSAKPHHQFGLASFAEELQILAPLGTPPPEIATMANHLTARGRSTELYRHSKTAIKLLADFPAHRKALFLFSDGVAEDTAYAPSEVVQSATESKVVIYGVGYPEAGDSPAKLQSLRRLSEETGGRFIQTTPNNFTLPAEFLQSPYTALDSGARLTVDLTPAIQAHFHDSQQVLLRWQTSGEAFSVSVPVRLPALPPPPPPLPPEESFFKRWWPYLVSALFLSLLLGFLIWQRRTRKEVPEPPTEISEPPKMVYAYLEFLGGGDGHRYPMTSSTVRIGRHAENELQLTNDSVSLHHAEIHRQRDGKLVLTDLNSTNGVYVNGKKEKSVVLNPGEVIELGEVKLRLVK